VPAVFAGKHKLHMKVYLRHVKTKMYYSGWASWTGDVRQAVKFETLEGAMQRAKSDVLSHMEAVIQEGDSPPERVVPIVARPGK
jgi:hypothetical protein